MDESSTPKTVGSNAELGHDAPMLERWGRGDPPHPWLLQRLPDGYWTPWHVAEAEVKRLRSEADENNALRERLAGLLSAVALALRGPPPPLTLWSWHDLPERAAAAIAAIDLMQRTAQHLAAGRLHDSDCAMHNAPAYPAGPCDCGALGPNVRAKAEPVAPLKPEN